MRLLVQPGDGVRPLVKAIANAVRSIEIVIFRFEQQELERALANAVTRGVAVHALIAHTNRTGEESLRKLEMRLLAVGVTVARTADDLARYHGKLMIVDRRELYLLAFNLTYADIDRTRSFGIITRRPVLVREAARLFEADSARHPYEPEPDALVVSPLNAREELSKFIEGAKKELAVYDPKVSDRAMIQLLEERAAAGVHIRIIGRLSHSVPGVKACKLPQMRLHVRAMVRDRRLAFLGSQSLRAIELDGRREVGLIFREPKVVARIQETFDADWASAEASTERTENQMPADKVAKKVAKFLAEDLPAVAPVLNGAMKQLVGDSAGVALDPDEVEAAVKGAIKTAVKEVVSNMVEDAVEEVGRER